MKKFPVNSQEESNIESLDYWIDKMKALENYLLEQYKKNIDSVTYLVKSKKNKKIKERKDYNIFEFAPKSILNNKDLMLKAVDDSFVSIFNVCDELRDDRDFSVRYLNENKHSYYFGLKDSFLLETDIFNMCIKKDARTYTSMRYNRILTEKYGKKENALEFLDLNPKVYEHFPIAYKDDLEVAKKAIDLDLSNVEFMKKIVSAKIFKDKELAEKLMNKNVDFFVKLNNKFRDDDEFLKLIIPHKPSLIEYVSPRLKANKSFVRTAIAAYNLLENISDDLKKDAELMELHLEHCPYSHYYLNKHIDVKPLLMNVIKKKYYMYEYLDEEKKQDPDYIFAVLDHVDFYKKTPDGKTDVFGYTNYYSKVSIFQILPREVMSSIILEYIEKYPNSNLSGVSEQEKELEYLSFARKKYANLYINKTLKNEEITTKRLKI